VASERRELEAKLARLSKYGEPVRGRNGAKGYKVEPKYRNPADPTQTWAGRGMQPKWVAAALRSGSSLEDLMVNRS
jgi:DNA-binding protein H-NS